MQERAVCAVWNPLICIKQINSNVQWKTCLELSVLWSWQKTKQKKESEIQCKTSLHDEQPRYALKLCNATWYIKQSRERTKIVTAVQFFAVSEEATDVFLSVSQITSSSVVFWHRGANLCANSCQEHIFFKKKERSESESATGLLPSRFSHARLPL